MSKIFSLRYGFDSLEVLEDRDIEGFYNGGRVTASESSKDFSKRALPVLEIVTRYMLGSDHPVYVNVDKKKKSIFQTLLDHVENNPCPEKYVLEVKPDELYENTPLESYASKLASSDICAAHHDSMKFAEDLKSTVAIADGILRTEIPGTVWGSKEINKTVSGMQSDMGYIPDVIEAIDGASEKIDMHLSYIRHAMEKNPGSKSHSMLRDTLATAVKEMVQLRKVASQVAQSLNSLLGMDDMVKKNTGYPSTWFFNASALYDFTYGYEDVIRGMMRSATIESRILRPLGNTIGA